MRFIQCPQTHKLIPAEQYERPKEHSHAIHGDIEGFLSPVDQTVITDRKQLAEHNRRNNVVNADEFSSEYLAGKAKEREDFFSGNRSSKQVYSDRQDIYNALVQYERDN
jgi:hypothetical protein